MRAHRFTYSLTVYSFTEKLAAMRAGLGAAFGFDLFSGTCLGSLFFISGLDVDASATAIGLLCSTTGATVFSGAGPPPFKFLSFVIFRAACRGMKAPWPVAPTVPVFRSALGPDTRLVSRSCCLWNIIPLGGGGPAPRVKGIAATGLNPDMTTGPEEGGKMCGGYPMCGGGCGVGKR